MFSFVPEGENDLFVAKASSKKYSTQMLEFWLLLEKSQTQWELLACCQMSAWCLSQTEPRSMDSESSNLETAFLYLSRIGLLDLRATLMGCCKLYL